MDLKKELEKKWYIEHYDGCPAFIENTGCGFTNKKEKLPVYSYNLSYFKEDIGDWFSLADDHKRIGNEIVSIYLNNKKYFLEVYKIWKEHLKLVFSFFYDNQQKNLKTIDNSQLLEHQKRFYAFYGQEIEIPGFIDGFMFYADKRLNTILSEFCRENKISNCGEIFSVLSAPVLPSFISYEEKELKKKIKEDFDFINSESADEHLKKYSWIKSSYAGYKEYSKEDLKNEMKRLEKESIEKDNNNPRQKKEEKSKLIKKYKFTPEIIALSELSELVTKWQDERKEYTLTFVTLLGKFFDEVSKRTGISIGLLKYTISDEIGLILEKKFDTEILKKRKNGCIFCYENGKVKDVITGKSADDFLKNISEVDTQNIKEIKGMTASVGKAVGHVKIMRSLKDMRKVQKGDILVAAMTRPEHLPALRKAKALVTDDGGITCHAAIISRELCIPCIIGTRIATKVLKDGDMVEVDAKNGIVKKI